MSFMGYRRPEDSVGVRNHIAVISTVTCANEVESRIANQVEGAVCLTHNMGCGHYIFAPLRPLAGLGKNRLKEVLTAESIKSFAEVLKAAK